MDNKRNLEIRLKRHPIGLPSTRDFNLVETPIPDVRPNHFLVRNIYMSVDPYMRNRMVDRASYIAPFRIGRTLEGGCVGRVIKSLHRDFADGDYVLANQGWRRYFISNGRGIRPVDPDIAPLTSYLGVLGMPGRTAYVGLLDIGRPQPGQTLVVSGAAGAVGSVVCQLGLIQGCRVVGSAGSDDKVAWLQTLGVAAYNYKTEGSHGTALRERCPDGIDICFENVGSLHLEVCIGLMNDFGRVVLCGMIAHYNAIEPMPGPRNMALAISKRLTMQGFLVSDHRERIPDFQRDMAAWIADGQIQWRETIVEGLENAPKALIGLFKGENIGKMLVRIGPED